MLFVLSLVLALLFTLGLNRSISKHPVMWYVIAIALVVFECIYYGLGWYKTVPAWFAIYFTDCFRRGAFPTALFVIVMYTGVLRSDWNITRKLRNVRGELSIIACFLTLGHNLIYGREHFVNLFTNPRSMDPRFFVAAIISLTLIVIMIPLMVTSFQCVRKQMSANSWKRLQRWAYVFYALLYVHIMVLYIPIFSEGLVNIIVYTVVFGCYFLAKVYKCIAKTNIEKKVKKAV